MAIEVCFDFQTVEGQGLPNKSTLSQNTWQTDSLADGLTVDRQLDIINLQTKVASQFNLKYWLKYDVCSSQIPNIQKKGEKLNSHTTFLLLKELTQ